MTCWACHSHTGYHAGWRKMRANTFIAGERNSPQVKVVDICPTCAAIVRLNSLTPLEEAE